MSDERGILLKKEQVDLIREMYPYSMPNGYQEIPGPVRAKVLHVFPHALSYIGDEKIIIARYQHNGCGKVWGVALWNLRWPLENGQLWMLVGHFGHDTQGPLSLHQIDWEFCEPIRRRASLREWRGLKNLSKDDRLELERRESYLKHAITLSMTDR